MRLAKELTKEYKKENKFAKRSMTPAWTDAIYKIEHRNGPNTWRICNLDGTQPKNEIKIWQTFNLKKTNEQPAINNFVDVKAARKERAFLLEIPKEERA